MSRGLSTAAPLRLAFGEGEPFFSLPQSRHLALAHYSSRTDGQDGRSKDIFSDDVLRDIGSYCKMKTVHKEALLANWRRGFLPAHATTSLISLVARLPAGLELPPEC